MRIRKTFLSTKYRSMLVGGTLIDVMASLVIMADTLIAGIMLGESAAAAVNLVLPVYSLASFFAMLFSLGTPILYANKIGSGQKEDADRTFGAGLFTALVTGILLFFGLIIAGEDYIASYRSGAQVVNSAKEYLVWMKYVVFFMPVEELLSGMIYADGDEKICTIGNVVSGVGKVPLSILFCRTMGIRGLGLATFLGVSASFAIHMLHFLRKTNTLRLKLTPSLQIVKHIVKYSVVDASSYLFIAVFTAAMNHYVVRTYGADMLILVSVVTLIKEVQTIFDGIGEATTPILSLYLGEGTYPGVREIWNLARRSSVIEGLGVTALLICAAPEMVRLLGIETPETEALACEGIRILSLGLIFTCRMYLDTSNYILADKIPLGVLVSALRDVVVSIPIAVLGSVAGGIHGMFVGLMLAQPIGYLISVFYVWSRYGKENYPLFIAEKEREKKLLFYEFPVVPDSIIRTRDAIGTALSDTRYPLRAVNQTMLLFEELYMLIYERNQGKRVLAECSVELGEDILLIAKDDGDLLDLSDLDRGIDSLRGYVFTSLVERFAVRRGHLMTLSYNRHTFTIRCASGKEAKVD